MRIIALKLATLIIFCSCRSDRNHFDIYSQDFNRRSSHHYSKQFSDTTKQIGSTSIKDKDEIISIHRPLQSDPKGSVDEENNNVNTDFVEPEESNGMLYGLFSLFSDDDEIDSLARVINDCEERLYSTTDESNFHQGTINALMSERNNLLKQLDSLQAVVSSSKRISNRRLLDMERNQQKLESLIKILISEIE